MKTGILKFNLRCLGIIIGTVICYLVSITISYQIRFLFDNLGTVNILIWAIITGALALLNAFLSICFIESAALKLDLTKTEDLNNTVIDKILNMSQGSYLKKDKGYYLNICTNVVPTCAGLYQQLMTALPSYIIITLLIFAVVFYNSWIVGLAFLIYVPINILCSYLPSKDFFQLSKEALDRQDVYIDYLKCVVESKKQINIVNAERFYASKFAAGINGFIKFVYKFKLISNILQSLPQHINTIFSIVTIGFSVYLYSLGNISLGTIFLNYQMFQMLSEPLSSIIQIIVNYKVSMGSLERVKEIITADKESARRPKTDSFIALKNFELYNNEEQSDALLKIAALNININDFIVIKGANGSGKSLLLNYIMGLENETFGKGEVFTNVGAKETAFLTYPVLLTNGSFKENNFEKPYDKALIQMLNIDFEDKIITTNPINLSLGQQQKLNLLRALSKNCKHIILDEPFTNLDADTCEKLIDYLKQIKGTKTIIIISHEDEIQNIADETYTINNNLLVMSTT